MNKKQPIIIHVAGWFDYVDLYYKYGKPSLVNDVKRLEDEGYEVIWNEVEFDREKLPVYTNSGNLSADVLLSQLRLLIKRAIDTNAIVFMAAPDMIWGQNSMYNMVKLAEGKDEVCIAAPHLRVIDNDFQNKTPTNRELVDRVFNYPHQAFLSSFDHNDANGTLSGGLSIRKIDDNNYCVIANLPTVHLVQFNQRDQAFWDNNLCMGHWDRGWLYELYINNRLKLVGSSDIAFCAEITDENRNRCVLQEGCLNNDAFYNSGAHNIGLNKVYCSLIRGDNKEKEQN